MPIVYAVKHVFRSWKLFLALLIGVTLASTFFAGIDIKANATAKQALDEQLKNVYVDMQFSIPQTNSLNSTRLLAIRDKIMNVEGVADAEVISRFSWVSVEVLGKNYSTKDYARIAAIFDHSLVYDGWLNRPSGGIGENETYIPEDTSLANSVAVGDIIQVNITLYSSSYEQIAVPYNLTVAGFAQLTDKAAAIASGYQQWWMPVIRSLTSTDQSEQIYADFLLLISWEKTMPKILEKIEEVGPLYRPAETSALVYLNREALINPWDIGTSINNIVVVQNSILNTISPELGYVSIQNNLESPLRSFQSNSMYIQFMFTLVSLPIFFMAWYMGTTVSDVSFNLRRREIGLLLTKGFSKGQIQRTFLIETLLVGFFGGLLGVLLGFVLNPIFTQFSVDTMFNPRIISPYTVAFTVSFGMIIAFLSTYSPAKRASQLPAVDALREYLPTEAERPYRKKLPWIALILGTYKLAVSIMGINMVEVSTRIMFSGGNFILILLVGILVFLDFILSYIGSTLFFWGFTKLFIQISLEFQQLTARAAKFLGELSVLATKNVRRNPARSAAVAFLIALIVGYSVQVIGQLSSEQDYVKRSIYYHTGADISVTIPNTNNISDSIIANVSQYIQNATTQYTTSASIPSVTIKAVEPETWLKTAYYEDGWFSETDVQTAFSAITSDKNTIILERRIALSYNLKIGENISLTFGTIGKLLRVVGFFGPEPSEQQSPIYIRVYSTHWSYISMELYDEVKNQASGTQVLLLKLKDGVNGKGVAEDIRDYTQNQYYVESFAERWEEAQTDILSMGVLDVQRLGIIFAILAASVGTALVSAVSMKERSREATIMSVKGLSYKQLVLMFLTENLALVVFSVVLGFFVGIIILYGNISASNAMIVELVKRRLVFPLDASLTLTSCLALIFVATILPILIMARRYVTKLERMVRLR